MQATVAHDDTATELLDIRGLSAPDNVLSVLARVSTLPAGAGLQIRADCNPWQLYDLLQQRGFTLLMQQDSNGHYAGKIIPRDLAALKH